MNLALIETSEHLSALVQHCEIPQQTECWLYDARLLSEVEAFGFHARILSERDLNDECNKISAWAREKALNWFNDDHLKRALSFHGVNLLDACSHFTSYALSWLVDCYRLVDLHLAHDISHVFLFERPEEVSLNSILACVVQDRRIRSTIIRFSQKPSPKKELKERLRDAFRKVFACLCQFLPYAHGSFVFSGGLRHLSPLIQHLKGRYSSILLEDLFQVQQLVYCMKNGIHYSLFSGWWATEGEKEMRSFQSKVRQQLPSLLKAIEEKGLLNYKGEKMPGIESLLLKKIFTHFPRCLRDILIARRIAKSVRPRGVILDDDTNAKRAFALSLQACGVAQFVIAHGEMGLAYRLASGSSNVSIGEMFVNSPYSKKKHSSVGWDESKLIVTGLPQYDRIAKLKINPLRTLSTTRKKVLYCPHYMALNCIKGQKPFEESFRAGDKGTILNNEAVLRAIEAIDCDLWVKFYRDETRAWEKFLKACKLKKNIRFFHHSDDIFKLLSCCDLLVSGDVSTVVLEGMMFDKPVVSLNFSGFADVHPYPGEGMVLGVYRPEDLASAIKTCLYDETYLNELRQRRRQRESFYWGGGDGHSTERVWQEILKKTKEL